MSRFVDGNAFSVLSVEQADVHDSRPRKRNKAGKHVQKETVQKVPNVSRERKSEQRQGPAETSPLSSKLATQSNGLPKGAQRKSKDEVR